MGDLSFDKLSKKELSELLRDLRAYRQARKKIGIRANSLLSESDEKIRVELPLGADPTCAGELLSKLGFEKSQIEYIYTQKLNAGIRIFENDTLYDASLHTLTQKI